MVDGIPSDNEMHVDNFLNIEICQHNFSNMLIKVGCVRTSIRVSVCELLCFNVI